MSFLMVHLAKEDRDSCCACIVFVCTGMWLFVFCVSISWCRKAELVDVHLLYLFLPACDYLCSVSLPHSAMFWSAVGDCYII